MIAVCIQGGAMRSMYCVGAVRAISERGILHEIDSIHTSSAGCVSGAVLADAILSGAEHFDMRSITVEFLSALNGKQFIDSRRLSGIVDVDHLVSIILRLTGLQELPTSNRRLRFEVTLTDCTQGSAVYFDLANASKQSIETALRGTMAIPVLYRKRVILDGRQYVDGGIVDPLPVIKALSYTPSTLIAISSVPTGELGTEVRERERSIVQWIPGIPPLVRHLMLARNPLADAAERVLSQPMFGDTKLISISPSKPELLGSRLELDPERLQALEEMGYTDALAAFDQAN